MEPNIKPITFKRKYITILSMDGGGVRGIFQAFVLRALEQEIKILEGNEGARIADYFDIIAGTSVGGINASLLTVPDDRGHPKYSTQDLVDFHSVRWAEIFPPISDKNIEELMWVSELVGPKHRNAGLCEVMEKMLGDAKLTDTTTHVVMTSFNIKTMQPHLFTTFQAKLDKTFDAPLKHVTVATASAPLHMPPYYFVAENNDAENRSSTEYNMVDGYVVADNPTWIAVTEGLKEYTRKHGKSSETICKLMILSLGTGEAKFASKYDAKSASKWGTIQWLYSMENRTRPFTDVFQAAATNLVDIQLKCFLDAVGCTENYLRIQKKDLDDDLVPCDNSAKENMEKLKELANELVKEKRKDIKDFAKQLVDEKRDRIKGGGILEA